MSNGGSTMVSPHLTRAFRRLTIGVTIASAVLSGLCGFIAPAAYFFMFDPENRDKIDEPLFQQYAGATGIALGIVGGVAAGLLWSYLMRRSSIRSLELVGHLSGLGVANGAALGLMVAIMATVFVHVGLSALSGFRVAPQVLTGLCLGVPAGVGLGAVCGALWHHSVGQAQRADLRAAPPSSAAAAAPPSCEEPR